MILLTLGTWIGELAGFVSSFLFQWLMVLGIVDMLTPDLSTIPMIVEFSLTLGLICLLLVPAIIMYSLYKNGRSSLIWALFSLAVSIVCIVGVNALFFSSEAAADGAAGTPTDYSALPVALGYAACMILPAAAVAYITSKRGIEGIIWPALTLVVEVVAVLLLFGDSGEAETAESTIRYSGLFVALGISALMVIPAAIAAYFTSRRGLDGIAWPAIILIVETAAMCMFLSEETITFLSAAKTVFGILMSVALIVVGFGAVSLPAMIMAYVTDKNEDDNILWPALTLIVQLSYIANFDSIWEGAQPSSPIYGFVALWGILLVNSLISAYAYNALIKKGYGTNFCALAFLFGIIGLVAAKSAPDRSKTKKAPKAVATA